METQTAKVVAVKDSVSNVKIITLDKKIDFKPGQWIYAFVGKWGYKIKKPYSIASLPGEPLELCVEDVGYVSNILCNLKEGDELEISGALGDFTIKGNAKNIIFVAFDTGIAPFKSMLQQVLESDGNAQLVYLSEKGEMLYEKYYKSIAEKNKNSALRQMININKDEFPERLKAALAEIEKIEAVYVCGLIYLVETARKVCKESGIKNVYFENYV